MSFATTMWDEVDNEGGAKVDRFRGGTRDAWRIIEQVLTSQVSAALMKTVDAKSKNIVIAIMGATGAGKSTFIGHAYGKTKKSLVSHHIKPHTAKVQPIEVTIDGCRITLLDTPGFDDDVTDTRVLVMIADWLQETYSNQVKLTGIIYLHRISDNRMTVSTPFKRSKTFAQICGTSAADRLVLVTTMWGCVRSDIGRRREESLKNGYWKGLIDRNAKVARFDATFESAQNIIRSIYEPLTRGLVNLQQANHDQPTLARRDPHVRGSDDIRSIPSYAPTSISTQNELPPSSARSRSLHGGLPHPDAADAISLLEIPDEDDFQTSDSDEKGGRGHIILPVSRQGGEQRHLHGYNCTMGYTKVEPPVGHAVAGSVDEGLSSLEVVDGSTHQKIQKFRERYRQSGVQLEPYPTNRIERSYPCRRRGRRTRGEYRA
ncbi:hypothetical protein BDN71DRAFT_249534 [Pleurotus eryngii]|uniref:G domain-containing protein n=1 Tax=Pleurotus eryngii TaxID=5323 RepID=A0A9P5ZM49_PLEER|nr:hypothetical protein BDN71DRAFT_249534 [Pleurotus eryngii]